MKRKILLVSLLSFAVLCFISAAKAEAKSAKVTKVSIKDKMSGVKQYSVITAKTSSGKAVWKYKTKKHDATELTATTMRTKGNRVYVFEDGKLRVFNKQTGKKIVSTKQILKGYQVQFVVDSSGACYAQPYYMDIVYKVSAKGKVLWKRNIKKTNLGWPGKIKIKKDAVRFYYDSESPEPYEDVTGKYIDFDKKTGEILQYKGEDGKVKVYSIGNNKISTRQNALQAYNKYLSSDTQKWGDNWEIPMSECEFAIKDFNNDNIPELILYFPNSSTAQCFERVYAYKNGKVKELFNLYSGQIDKIYTSKGICVVSGIHSGGCWEYYYKITQGKCKCVLTRTGSDSVNGHEGDFYYNKFYIGKKLVNKAKFQKTKKKLIGKGKNNKPYKYRKNTEENRRSILK